MQNLLFKDQRWKETENGFLELLCNTLPYKLSVGDNLLYSYTMMKIRIKKKKNFFKWMNEKQNITINFQLLHKLSTFKVLILKMILFHSMFSSSSLIFSIHFHFCLFFFFLPAVIPVVNWVQKEPSKLYSNFWKVLLWYDQMFRSRISVHSYCSTLAKDLV